MKYLSEVYGRGGIYAKCVAASIANGTPIYTLETKAPFTIDAEIEKHRMESTNSSSGRAIPISTTVQLITDDPYIPFDVRLNQKGMQGYKVADEKTLETFHADLYALKLYLREFVERNSHIHKQHLNDYIKPFLFQKKVWTATEWDNFFRLRLAPDVKPEMLELAKCMKSAIDQVEPEVLSLAQWHLPYVPKYDKEGNPSYYNDPTVAIKCSVARGNVH